MKFIRAAFSLLMTAVMLLCLVSCSKPSDSVGTKDSAVQATKTATADSTMDEYITEKSVAAENSPNVNGRRFTMTLEQFTDAYNAEKSRRREKDILTVNRWIKDGKPEADDNGVAVQYWHYNDDYVSFTASVEVESNRLINIGCGTAVNKFMGMTDDVNNSDIILNKAAVMAKVVCKLPDDEGEVVRDIFRQTTTGTIDTFWYSGFVFNLSTKEDKSDRKNSIMLFRVFPITEKLKAEWDIAEYVAHKDTD